MNLDPGASTLQVVNLPCASDLLKAAAVERKARGKAIQTKIQIKRKSAGPISNLAKKKKGTAGKGVITVAPIKETMPVKLNASSLSRQTLSSSSSSESEGDKITKKGKKKISQKKNKATKKLVRGIVKRDESRNQASRNALRERSARKPNFFIYGAISPRF